MFFEINMNLSAEIVETSQPVKNIVIWLHGLGADGHDFLPIVDRLNVPNTRFIFPHAPHRPITMNNGYEMRAWYDLYGLTATDKQDEAGMREMQNTINALIAQEKSKGIQVSNIVLAGFSQGGAMALFTALRYPEKLAGILALSTYVPLKKSLPNEATIENASTSIFMAHGSFDTVITMDTCKTSLDLLTNLRYPVQWHEYSMAHSVCEEEIQDINTFLNEIFFS
jgi:phospholipase/carboxylesterase